MRTRLSKVWAGSGSISISISSASLATNRSVMAASVLLGSAADNTGFGFAVGGGGGGTGSGAGSVLVACNNGLVSVAGPVPWNRSLERALDEASATGCLNLSGRKLKEFPRGAANHDLTDTTRADLSRNRLSDLPPEVCLLVSLESLNVYQNCLRSLPDHMINLQALTYLNLSRNQLSALPVVLCSLPLKVLIACNNKLVALPQEVGQLRHLTELDVSCNEIRTLPSQVGRLEALRDLNIRRNHLVALPPELAELPLVRLDFSCNKVTTIPLCYTRLSQLHTMVLDNNPLHTPPAQICIKGKVHIFKFLNMEASKTTLDLPEYDRRTLNFGSCVDEPDPGRPYGALDSGFNSVDSGDKRWSANEELSEVPARVLDVHKEPKRGVARSPLLANGTHELEQMDFIDGEGGEEEEAGSAAGGERGAGERASLSSQFMAYIERRISNTGSPGKAVFSRTDDSRQRQSRSAADGAPASPGDQIQVSGRRPLSVERMRREAQLAALRYDEERHRTRAPQRDAKSPNKPGQEAKNIYPCRRSTHTDDSALFMGEERGGLSPSAGPAHPGSGDAAACRGAGLRPESFLYRLSQREEKRRGDAPASTQHPQEATSAALGHDAQLVEQLRKNIEGRLKVSLPSDLGAALTDGVVLCHLANHVRPRSVPSIHVPSPAVPKLTMAKCRRNVENFLEACRRMGVAQSDLCLPLHILEEEGLPQVAATVSALLHLAPPRHGVATAAMTTPSPGM
ncbi:leucine-rich repeat and calponin homology domain-containing protein 3 isoform X2 [Hippocampus comes]|uniref:Leucine-rich repeats and calponin homology (CH) domain containing 3 n=1 Tax=Hippocampus comes TaxID=109280 RepID=A0A3Q2XJW0_HIPCM|nr:PREDICTED: leucine-rich repeat and calponin homology domain-containing protein 3-like isoform X1 [Hippocampus comes]XP_019723423.1 PREDICTED: leucine-rich repeat and calponin homology domain-containing protein 3-like isoform X2 [Hippocampus comes]